jgi:hypothetical protein
MDVYEHERCPNIILGHKLKYRNRVFNNEEKLISQK